MRINRDARLAILTAFERRDIRQHEIWQEFAEREGYGRPASILSRIEADFGPHVALDVQDALIQEVAHHSGPLPLASPPRTAAAVEHDVKNYPEQIVPMVLPDELFGSLIEIAWAIFAARDLEAFHESLGSVYQSPSDEWLNNILKKQRAPCRLVDGKIEWTDEEILSEQPLASELLDEADLRAELRRIREAFRRAQAPDDYNAIGMRCDRLLRSLGQAFFDPDLDLPEGEPEPSKDDCKQRLTLFFTARATGKENTAIRRLAAPLVDAAYTQAQIAKHDRDVGREATAVAISSICTLIDLIAAVKTPTLAS